MEPARCKCGARFVGKQQHCKVKGCHLTFAGDEPGEAHRVGPYDPPGQRRCLTEEEMLAGGMWSHTSAHGTEIWHGRVSKTGQQRRRITDIPLPTT